MARKRIALACIMALAAAFTPAASAQTVFVLDDAVKMSPEGEIFSHVPLEGYESNNPVWDGRAVTLAGARAERLAFQVMVRAGEGRLDDVDVEVSDLTGPKGTIDAADNVKRFREWYTQVTMPSTSPMANAGLGFYPDALIAADIRPFGLPVDVEAGKVQGIWVDVIIPRAAAPGEYTGTVTVTSGRGEQEQTIAELPLTLRVWDFEIPAERHLRWRIGYTGWETAARHYGYEPMSQRWLEIEREIYRLCWEDCRFVPTTHYSSPRPPFTWENGVFQWDWEDYDRRFGAYLDGSAFADGEPVNIFSLPINVRACHPTGARRPSEADRFDADMLAAAVKALIEHWNEKGWSLDGTFVYVADEPNPGLYPFIKAACKSILEASDGKIRTSVAFYTHFREAGADHVREFSDYVTMWDIAGDCWSPDAFELLKQRQAKGDFIGFYQGSEPFVGSEALDGDGVSLTTWPWIAWRHGLDTLFLYNMTEWGYFRLNRGRRPWADRIRDIWVNPMNQSWQTNSQGVLLYPGYPIGYRGVVPSIRMKDIRRGMQDYEYFWLLSQAGKRELADAIAERIIPESLHEPEGWDFRKASWERDPREWHRARRKMAEAITAE